MALISCPECSKEVSDKVKDCPHCGYPFEEKADQTLGNTEQIVNQPSASTMKRNNKKVAILASAIVLILIVLTVGILIVKNANDRKREEQAFNDYIDKLNNLLEQSLEGGSKAESLCNLTAKVWYNSIHEKSDYETNKFTQHSGKFYDDFNDALELLFLDADTIKVSTSVKAYQGIVGDTMKELQNPPVGLDKCYDMAVEMYSCYNSLSKLAVDPTGSYNQFAENKQILINDYLKYYDLLKTQIPDKK